jgi:hypothetical protein
MASEQDWDEELSGSTRPYEPKPDSDSPVDRDSLTASDVVSADALDDPDVLAFNDQRRPTDRQVLEEILERVQRIEAQLEGGGPQVPPPWERR